MHMMPVAAKPALIPTKVEVDVSALDIGDALHASDIKLAQGVRVVLDAKEAIASVVAPKAEKVEEARRLRSRARSRRKARRLRPLARPRPRALRRLRPPAARRKRRRSRRRGRSSPQARLGREGSARGAPRCHLIDRRPRESRRGSTPTTGTTSGSWSWTSWRGGARRRRRGRSSAPRSSRRRSEASALLLCKPQEYMNVSGQAVARVAGFWKIGLAETIVVHDELDLPFERIKLGAGGGPGGHNGIKSIISALGDPGVRARARRHRPARPRARPADYVLSTSRGPRRPRCPT
jgi:PTH1 family peptidyl-tRNA hydrolase